MNPEKSDCCNGEIIRHRSKDLEVYKCAICLRPVVNNNNSEKSVEYKANFLWPHDGKGIEFLGYEFANAKTESYRKEIWQGIIELLQSERQKVIDLKSELNQYRTQKVNVVAFHRLEEKLELWKNLAGRMKDALEYQQLGCECHLMDKCRYCLKSELVIAEYNEVGK